MRGEPHGCRAWAPACMPYFASNMDLTGLRLASVERSICICFWPPPFFQLLFFFLQQQYTLCTSGFLSFCLTYPVHRLEVVPDSLQSLTHSLPSSCFFPMPCGPLAASKAKPPSWSLADKYVTKEDLGHERMMNIGAPPLRRSADSCLSRNAHAVWGVICGRMQSDAPSPPRQSGRGEKDSLTVWQGGDKIPTVR